MDAQAIFKQSFDTYGHVFDFEEIVRICNYNKRNPEKKKKVPNELRENELWHFFAVFCLFFSKMEKEGGWSNMKAIVDGNSFGKYIAKSVLLCNFFPCRGCHLCRNGSVLIFCMAEADVPAKRRQM